MLGWATNLFSAGLKQGKRVCWACCVHVQKYNVRAHHPHVRACATEDVTTETSEMLTPGTDMGGGRRGRVDIRKALDNAEEHLELIKDHKDDWASDDWVEEGWARRVGMEDEDGNPTKIEKLYEELERKKRDDGKFLEEGKEERVLAGEIIEGFPGGGNVGVVNWSNALQQQSLMARGFWKEVVCMGDTVIDATCGNGRDSVELLKLLRLAGGEGRLMCVDLQSDAIENTKAAIRKERAEEVEVSFHHGNHETFSETLIPGSVALVVYNLGYLPGGDQSLITKPESTLKSLEAATRLVRPFGMISVMLYQGHEGGTEEKESVLEWSKSLDPKAWNCCHFEWTNRREAPSLLLVRKITL